MLERRTTVYTTDPAALGLATPLRCLACNRPIADGELCVVETTIDEREVDVSDIRGVRDCHVSLTRIEGYCRHCAPPEDPHD